MKFLVLGATGMAGHTIAYHLYEKGHCVTGYSRQPLPGISKALLGDVRHLSSLKNLLSIGDYDCVINCVGVLNQFAERNVENAVFLNSYLPHWLVKVTSGMKTRVIHISTDCVFSGIRGKYRMEDVPDGTSVYARSKALGEIHDNKNLTFRTSIVGPDMHDTGIGLFHWFMKQNGEMDGYTRAIWSGVTTLTLAKAIESASMEQLTGVYHLTNNHAITKYQLLQMFNQYFREGQRVIRPVEGICLDKSLINERNDFSFRVPPYEYMISEMRGWILDHIHLYPRYHLQA